MLQLLEDFVPIPPTGASPDRTGGLPSSRPGYGPQMKIAGDAAVGRVYVLFSVHHGMPWPN